MDVTEQFQWIFLILDTSEELFGGGVIVPTKTGTVPTPECHDIKHVSNSTPSDKTTTMAPLGKRKGKRRQASIEAKDHADEISCSVSEIEPRKRKSKRRQATSKETQDNDQLLQLSSLLSEMEQHMALDRILEARKVVDQINQIPNANISSKQQEEMEHIVHESNHVEELMHDLQSDNGWTLCRSRNGITVHYRNEKGDPIHAVKTHTVLENYGPTDFVHLCSLFAESDLLPLWFPANVLDSVELIVEPSKYRQIVRMVMKFHYVPITDREVICEGIGYHIQDENAFLLLTKSIDASPFCKIPAIPPRMVRMETRTAFFIKLLSGNRVEFCQISHDDLKFKYIPAFVTNYLSQGAVPFELIQSMKRVVSNYEGSEWDQRVQERRDFYAEIEERVHEELAVINVSQRNVTEVAESDNKVTNEYHSGISLETAMAAMSILVAMLRWIFDWFDISLWVCFVCFMTALISLTHFAFLRRHASTSNSSKHKN